MRRDQSVRKRYKEIFTNMTDVDLNMDNGGLDDTAEQKNKKQIRLPSFFVKVRESRITALTLAILFTLIPLPATWLAVLATESSKLSSHYLTDSEYYVPFTVSLICALLFSLLSFVLLDRSKMKEEHIVPRIFNLIPACGAAISAYLFFYFSSAEKIFEGENKWAMYIALCGAISAIFFILKIFGNKVFPKLSAGFRILTAIGVFAFCALIIISLYLDFNTELNSHFKLSVQFAAVGVMLGTMADSRSALGSVTVRRYLAFKSLALALTLTGASSVLIRAYGEIAAYKLELGVESLSVHDVVSHFQSYPTVSASYVICSVFFMTYAACVISEILFTALSSHKSEA